MILVYWVLLCWLVSVLACFALLLLRCCLWLSPVMMGVTWGFR
jgi:hypothetical protein